LAISVFGQGGVRSQRAFRDLGQRAVESMSQEMETSSLTLVSRVDTLFWPRIHALNSAHLGAGFPRIFDHMDFAHFYDGVASPALLARRMVAVAESGRAVALVEDPSWPDEAYLASLGEELVRRGYASGDPIELGPGFRVYQVRSVSIAADSLRYP
jgi:hypothetical protein